MLEKKKKKKIKSNRKFFIFSYTGTGPLLTMDVGDTYARCSALRERERERENALL